MIIRHQYAAIAGLAVADGAELLGLAQTMALLAVAVAVIYAVFTLRAEIRQTSRMISRILEEQQVIRLNQADMQRAHADMQRDHADMQRRLVRLENGG